MRQISCPECGTSVPGRLVGLHCQVPQNVISITIRELLIESQIDLVSYSGFAILIRSQECSLMIIVMYLYSIPSIIYDVATSF